MPGFEDLSFDAAKILKTALKKGGDYAEIYADHVEGLQIISEQKKIEKISPTIDRGIGIRVLWKDKTAYGFTNEITEKSLLELAASVAEAVRTEKFEKPIVLKEIPPPLQFQFKKNPRDFDLKQKNEFIQRAESVAWGADSKIIQVKTLYAEIFKKMAQNSFVLGHCVQGGRRR